MFPWHPERNHEPQPIEAHPDMKAVELGLSVDDHEAQSLGWPTASAHATVISRMTALLPLDLIDRIVIVPRGSTVATAAAAEQHWPP
jgi:hypothetical protein